MYMDFSKRLLIVKVLSHHDIRTDVTGFKISICNIWNNLLKNSLENNTWLSGSHMYSTVSHTTVANKHV